MTTPSLDWQPHGACTSLHPDLFFSENAADVAAAKAICAKCPVQKECDDWATATKQEYGVWGGRLRSESSTAINHGTYTGYVRGCRRTDCAENDGCAGAKRRYSADARARKAAAKAKAPA